MRIIRYLDKENGVGYAVVRQDGKLHRLKGSFEDYTITEEEAEVKLLLSPVEPRAIYGVGLNYREHAAETGKPVPERPMIFMKGPNTIQNPGQPIVLPRHLRSDKVDFEGELAVVIGKVCRNVAVEDALDCVLGYTCANDVSARDWQWEWGGGQYCRGKSFDTFCPLGPCLVTKESIPDPSKLGIRTTINGERMQDSSTEDMIFSVPELISFLSGSSTLLPGTVILTGTPPGVGAAREPKRFLQPEDEVTVEVERIGALANKVIEEPLGEEEEA